MIETARGTLALTRIAWRASRWRVLLSLLLMVFQFASLPLAAPALAALTDGAVSGDARRVTVSALTVAALAIATLTAGHFGRVVYYELGEKVQLAIEQELMELSNGSAGIEHHERPEYADRLRVISQEVDWAGWATMNFLFSSFGLAIGAMITAVLLATLNPWLLLLPLFAVPSLALGRKAEATVGRARLLAAPHTRRARHVFRLATDPGPAKEIRACNLAEEMRDRQREAWNQASAVIIKGEDRGALLRVGGQLVFACGYITGTLIVAHKVVSGHGTVGDVVLAFILAAQVNQQVNQAATLVAGLQRTARTLSHLEWIRALVKRTSPAPDLELPATISDGITLRDVSFAYPGTDAVILSGVNLHLPAGQTVAIVGENGAGKTTLVKLLCGFYEATSGSIEIDGIDLSRYHLEDWRERIAAGFQDFVRFEFLAREVIGLGDLPHIDDEDAVRHALHQARGDDLLGRLTNGLDTHLGKASAAGTELSGGQWQKLALARAMMRQTPLLLLLDEPTSALDAQAEHTLFEDYAASAKRVAKRTGGITVLVSHRFSTVRMADLILVVNGGRIHESGSHAQLMALGGLYAELYALQASAYS